MKASIWHHIEVKQPKQTGHYLGVKQTWIGDEYPGIDFYYYYKPNKMWMTNNMMFSARVIYWTEANPYEWLDDAPTIPNPSLEKAFQKIQNAIAQYELIKSLTGKDVID